MELDLSGDFEKAFCGLIQLRLKAEDTLPGNILYRNEVRRLQEEATDIELRVNRIDEELKTRRLTCNVPQYQIQDVVRDIRMFSENISFLKHQLDMDIQEEKQKEAFAGAGGENQVQKTSFKFMNSGEGEELELHQGMKTPSLFSLPLTPINNHGTGTGGLILSLNGNNIRNEMKTPENRIQVQSPNQERGSIVIPATPSTLVSSPCQCEQCQRHRDPHNIHGSPAHSTTCSSCLFFASPVSSLSSLCQCQNCAPELWALSSPSVSSSAADSGYYTSSHTSRSTAASDR